VKTFLDFKYLIISTQLDDGPMNINEDGSLNDNSLEILRKLRVNIGDFSYMRQTHDTIVQVVTKAGVYLADGLISKNVSAVGIRSADCVPVVLYGPDLIGAVHVSRVNLIGGIIDNLHMALNRTGSFPADLKLFLGPHIRVKNYQIGGAALEQVRKTRFSDFLIGKDYDFHFDLTAALCFELERIGVKKDNIEDCKIDTFKSREFLSCRKQLDPKQVKTFFTIIKRND